MPLYSPASSSSIGTDGWTPDTSRTWSWVSTGPDKFKVSASDVTAIFSKGTRIRLKQGGSYKYFVVTASSFSTDTTVTITGGSDYSLANAAITDNYYSYAANPQGYPNTFSFTATFTGFSADPSGVTYLFSIVGRILTLHFVAAIDGTSNGTGFTITLPVNSLIASYFPCLIKDNGALGLSPGLLELDPSGHPTTVAIFKTMGAGGFTASGAKNAWFTIQYEI